MKRLLLFVLLILLFACDAKKQGATNINSTIAQLSSCPKQGNCSVKIFCNSAMDIKSDENNENLHYELKTDNRKSIIVYSYVLTVPKGVMDGGLREEVVVEIENDANSGEIDFSIQNSKALFGRFCYCKGYTGYYPIKKGILKTTKKDNVRRFDFNFEIAEVPQVLKEIGFSIN